MSFGKPLLYLSNRCTTLLQRVIDDLSVHLAWHTSASTSAMVFWTNEWMNLVRANSLKGSITQSGDAESKNNVLGPF